MKPAPPVTNARIRDPRSSLALSCGRPVAAQADAKQVPQVSQVPPHELEPAVPVVPPADRDLRDAIPGADREIEDLDVEHVSVDTLPREDVVGSGAPEELETALGVGDPVQADDCVHARREDLRSGAAIPLLRTFHARLAETARPDDDVRPRCEARFELVEFGDGSLVVRVHETDHVPPNEADSFANASSLAMPSGTAGHFQPRLLR